MTPRSVVLGPRDGTVADWLGLGREGKTNSVDRLATAV